MQSAPCSKTPDKAISGLREARLECPSVCGPECAPHKRYRVCLRKYICKMVDYQEVRVDRCQGLWERLYLSEQLCT